MRNVISTLSPFLGPRSKDAEPERPSESANIPEPAQKMDSSSGKGVSDENVLSFLTERATGGQVAVLAAEVILRLTSVTHDALLPPHTAADLVKLDLLMSGIPACLSTLPIFKQLHQLLLYVTFLSSVLDFRGLKNCRQSRIPQICHTISKVLLNKLACSQNSKTDST